jgi:hypothetical protein
MVAKRGGGSLSIIEKYNRLFCNTDFRVADCYRDVRLWSIQSRVNVLHKLLYKKSTTVCPLVGIGTLTTPLSPASVPLPQNRGGGGGTLACG